MAELEAMGKKDPDYCRILDYVWTKQSFKELPSESKGSKTGREWPLLLVLPEFNVVIPNEANNGSKIFPPKQYRPLILEKMHETGKKSDSMHMRAGLTYTWPSIQ